MKLLAVMLFVLGFGRGLPAYAQSPDTVANAVTAAQVAARSWLNLVDRAQYGESWDSAASFFRTAVAKPAWEEAVRKARGPFDPFGARKLLSASFQAELPHAPPLYGARSIKTPVKLEAAAGPWMWPAVAVPLSPR